MKICFIIQARLGSTRLPQKIVRPFYGDKSILELLVEKLKQVSSNIIIATSISEENDCLQEIAAKLKAECYRGSENDVLQRFIDAAEANDVEHIIRVCSDNPFLELASIKQLIKEIVTTNGLYDYISFNVNGTPTIKTHYGFWTEYVTLSALKKVVAMTDDKLYHEHVTNYIYSHTEDFRIKLLPTSTNLLKHNIRLTIDTKEDFDNAKSIYENLCINAAYPTIDDIIAYLEDHPQYYKSMQEQIDINSK